MKPLSPQKCVNVTLPLSESVRMPNASWTIHTIRITSDRFHELSQLSVCPKALTHYHPPKLTVRTKEDSGDTTIVNQQTHASSEEKTTQSVSPFTVHCLIINLLERMCFMEEHLAKAMKRLKIKGRLPVRPAPLWTQEQYGQILQEMAIGRSELEKLFKDAQIAEASNLCMILYTGWRAFVPLYRDCGHPFWWAWHPFLIYPYLTEESVEFLVNKKVRGVATDAISIESPLTHWLLRGNEIPGPCWEPQMTYVDSLCKKHAHESILKRSVREQLLQRGSFVLESLMLTSAALRMDEGDLLQRIRGDISRLPPSAFAQLTVFPFSCKGSSDASLVVAAFFPWRKNDE